MQKEVQINCRACHSLSNYQYRISVYSIDDELMLCKDFNEDGSISFSLPRYGIYKMTIVLIDVIPQIMYKTVFLYLPDCKPMSFVFDFPKLRPTSRTITINIQDRNYPGLNLMKGEINLWQNLM